MWPWIRIKITEDNIRNQAEIMSALDNLNTNITALRDEWSQFLIDLQNVLTNPNTEAAVQEAADLVAQQTNAIAAEDTAIKGG